MFITDKNELTKYSTPYRLWQGVPGIEVTKKGRIFLTFYSGGTTEEVNNFAVLIKSDDGETFSEPIAVAFRENYRCYDPCLWIDPQDRLWFIWSVAPKHSVYAVICDNPDADKLEWSDTIRIGHDIMMNKPTVLSTGEWLFPVAVWNYGVKTGGFDSEDIYSDRRSFAYKTCDNGKTFEILGGADVEERSFDEHMILELNDSRLAMFVRTRYGIGVSYSHDRGKTWTKGVNSELGGPCSRFCIRRLKSGNIILINHYNFKKRDHLTALISDNDGKSWKYRLLLDERSSVSYPDLKEADDGFIYVTYDRERGASRSSLEETYSCAREILTARFTEADVIKGSLVTEGSYLKKTVSKLGEYALENINPYNEVVRFNRSELLDYLMELDNSIIPSRLFEHFGIHCSNLHMIDNRRLDTLLEKLTLNQSNKKEVLSEIIEIIYSADISEKESFPIIERIKNIASNDLENDLQLKDIAENLGMSLYYMCHYFKNITGVTIMEYRNESKLTCAKKLLLNSNYKISDIAQLCGFGSSSYFSKVFMESEKISPSLYRKLNKKQ